MAVKILGGLAKGQSLFVPKGDDVRPTTVMLRRRIFDAHQHWHGVTFVDACAGSGAMGFEAWSRGAREVILVEASKKVVHNLKKNIQKIQDANKNVADDLGEINLVTQSFEKWIKYFRDTYSTWDEEKQEECVIFFDPPYEMKDLYKKVVLEEIRDKNWFKGSLWIESEHQKGLPPTFWDEQGFEPRKVVTQGNCYIYIIDF